MTVYRWRYIVFLGLRKVEINVLKLLDEGLQRGLELRDGGVELEQVGVEGEGGEVEAARVRLADALAQCGVLEALRTRSN